MKLDPRSIPYRGLRLGVQWAVAVGTLGLVFGSMLDGAVGPALAGLAVAGAGLAGAGWAVAYHQRFEFELTAGSLDITSGVIARRTREIPLGRIQNVDIRQGVVPRLLGIAEVRFETAGGSGTEASLQYVDQRVAKELQERVDRHGEAEEHAPESDTAVDPTARRAPPRDEPLYAIKPVELALLSVTSIDWRAVGFVVLAGVGVLPDGASTGFEPAPFAPLAALAQPIFLTAAGLVGNAALLTARFYRFRLWRAGETLRYERGLLRRFSGSIPLDRVHLLRFRDNPVTRRLGFAALDIETAGYGPESEGGSQAAVPIAERGRVLELADSIEPVPDLELRRPPKRARWRYAIRYGALALLVTAGLFTVDLLVRPLPWYLGVALLAAAPPAAHLTWVHRGYALGERALLVRAGFWRRTTYLVPFYRVQTVGTTATVFQRRWSLATVRVDTASGAPAAHDLDRETARELREAVADDLLVDRIRRRDDGTPLGTGPATT
ncbi:MAG: PH domain-containing protein [Halobacteriales archaeon]|nr:PH domain-containing protein [Halobacteriales archaeon]